MGRRQTAAAYAVKCEGRLTRRALRVRPLHAIHSSVSEHTALSCGNWLALLEYEVKVLTGSECASRRSRSNSGLQTEQQHASFGRVGCFWALHAMPMQRTARTAFHAQHAWASRQVVMLQPPVQVGPRQPPRLWKPPHCTSPRSSCTAQPNTAPSMEVNTGGHT